MTRFYYNKRSKRKGHTWALRLIKYNWEVITHIWGSRNQQLHHTEQIHELEGIKIAREAIKKEWDIGLGRLPASQFSHFFRIPLIQLLEKPHDHLKTWLMIIRQGRILLDPGNLCCDEIEESAALQKWLDISYKIQDNEGKPALQDSIRAEWRIGKGYLPAIYDRYFSGSIKQLLTKSITIQKQWLCKIREGRMKYDNGNLLLDEFSTPGALKSWIGLK